MKLKFIAVAISAILIGTLFVALFVFPNIGIIDVIQNAQNRSVKTKKDESPEIVSHQINRESNENNNNDTPEIEKGQLLGPINNGQNQKPASTTTQASNTNSSPSCEDDKSCPSFTASPTGAIGNWALKFFDDFDGNALNASKWSVSRELSSTGISTPYNTTEESAYYSSSNVTVGDGYATLNIAPYAYANYTHRSGMIQNQKVFGATYGYYEARIKLPTGPDTITGFRLTPNSTDTIATNTITPLYRYNNSYPSLDYMWLENNENKHLGPLNYGNGVDVAQDFHTYGLLWDKNSIQVYFDGKPGPKYDNSSNITNSNHYISLSLNVAQSSNITDAKMLIDYVRFWQKQ